MYVLIGQRKHVYSKGNPIAYLQSYPSSSMHAFVDIVTNCYSSFNYGLLYVCTDLNTALEV